ncbi:MAG: manganese efflux pump MntP family protein, partial [Clostridiales bacterium]|nr:manganese efflux pump MntP family protein [Clostridiales bacterium]
MQVVSLILIALGLSADAFAVSVCNGLANRKMKKGKYFYIAAVFGIFQGLMPLVGYYLGTLFLRYVENYLKYVSFAILLLIGAKMILDGAKELRAKTEIEEKEIKTAAVLVQGVATSIDALAVGVSLLSFSIAIYVSAPVIAAVTFAVCLIGVFLGAKFGRIIKGKSSAASIAGGVAL